MNKYNDEESALIKFLLNQELRVETEIDPNLTVLQYLRNLVRKTGTKEGCASGDCGACTVVIGEPDGERMRYRTLNSCLTFVAALDGKQLITVEGLQDEGVLHQVQQSMVDCHGSQCGFCTPGFIMSMFALYKNESQADRHKIEEALAGNLCRCTGYRPIVEAAEQMYTNAMADKFDRLQEQTLQQLGELQPQQTAELKGAGRVSFSPTTLDELAALYEQHPAARLLAGGTDLALEVTQFHRELPTLIYLGQVAELKQIHEFDDRIEFGAAAPLSDCAPYLSREYPSFGQLLQRFASLQIRNQGTLGGNIGNASPIGDAPPALIALNAEVVLRKGSKRRILALKDYFIDYKVTARQESEFIEKIIVPKASAHGVVRFYKVSKRLDDDISAVLGAFNLTLQQGIVTEARIAFGGMAAIPKRARACEQVLLGHPLDEATLARARQALSQDFTPISDFRASKEYRLLVAQNLLTRYALEITTPELATQVTAHV